jgi:peptidoglycan/xylan/chitin deacetylase (PgdA/CDA1 family)
MENVTKNEPLRSFGGKMKAVTFSYDDGVTQDRRLVHILNKYGLKCTFNINSAKLGEPWNIYQQGANLAHVKLHPDEVRKVYEGHEIAVHTLHHPALRSLSDEDIIKEVEEDRVRLSELAGYEVVGMAYPGGTTCMNAHVAEVIRDNTGVKYSRTTTATYKFELPADLLVLDPTVHHHADMDGLFRLAEEFIDLRPDSPKMFYIWGHAYEFDVAETEWERFEEFCRLISGRSDIYYGTNREVLLGY